MAEMQVTGVQGMRDFLAKMRRMNASAPTMTRVALNEVSLIVVADARRRAPVKSGALRNSIRASSTVGGKARVSEGGSKVPYAGFIDYGGTVGRYRHGSVHQSAVRQRTARHFAVRPYIKTGRVLYPAFNANRDRVNAALQDAMVKVAKQNGLEVT